MKIIEIHLPYLPEYNGDINEIDDPDKIQFLLRKTRLYAKALHEIYDIIGDDEVDIDGDISDYIQISGNDEVVDRLLKADIGVELI